MKRSRRPHLWMIALIGVIVPRRLRADWREEWDAELRSREALLEDWDRLDAAAKWALFRRSAGAFRDALWLQRRRLEDDAIQDLRIGVRTLRKTPATTAVAIATLALGIGANTAIFGMLNALLFRPLDGVAHPERLVQMSRQYAGRAEPSDSTYPDFLDYRQENRVMQGVAVTSPRSFDLSTGAQTERIAGELVSDDYFDVLGVTPAAGRLIASVDAGQLVAVLSNRLWRQDFGGDANAIGATIDLDGHAFNVIGVADARFSGVSIGNPRDVWVPLLALRQVDPGPAAHLDQRGASWVQMFGRLRPGVTMDAAQRDCSRIARRLEEEFPATNTHAGVRLDEGVGRDVEMTAQVRRFASLPIVAGALLLLIACANIAGLLLARGAARRREMATRIALGASRLRLIRQLLTESILLALAGGVAGLVTGGWLMGWLRSALPDRYLFLSFDLDFGIDWHVFGFLLAVSVFTGLFFGVVPALRATRVHLVPALKSSRASGAPVGRTSRGVLVVIQVALSLVLLVAAGLCVRTLRNAAAIDTGYAVDGVLNARFDLAKQGYGPDRGRAAQAAVLERVQAIPGVRTAGFAMTLPLNDTRWEDAVHRAGDPTRLQTFANVVSPSYFEVMDVALLAGRRFSERDDPSAPPVAVINQRLATLMWPGQHAIDRQLTFGNRTIDVVGVVRDVKGRNLFEPSPPMLYLPLAQNYKPAMILHVRLAATGAGSGGARIDAALADAIRRAVWAVDPHLPVYGVTTIGDALSATLSPQRLLARMIAAFGVLALMLAGVGLYGVLSHTVAERTWEIGVRMALGAEARRIRRLYLWRGLRLATLGAALGLGAAAFSTHFMAGALYGVSPTDPATFAAVTIFLLVASAAACYVPARRAAGLNPVVSLRLD